MNYLFPLSYLANGLATTVLLIGLGLAGRSLLAADVGLVQGAVLATFYAFSGNARSLILNAQGARHFPAILGARVLLALPLSLLAWGLCVLVAGVAPWIASALVLRRCAESFSELQLSLQEREGDREAALRQLVLQGVALVFALVWSIAGWEGWIVVWFAWAAMPLVIAGPSLARFRFLSFAELRGQLPQLYPHFGSTAIIGIAVYVFRLLILLFGGRSFAGDLFTAFALGSFVGSVFANVLGPSIVWHQSRTGERVARWLDQLVLPGLVGMGIALVLAAQFLAREVALLGRPLAFWEAVGISLCGGAVMLVAQRKRLALLQTGSGVSLFGADMLINLLLLMAIPFAFALWGARGLVTLYAANALLCLVFYSSAGGAPRRQIRRAGLRLGHLHAAIGVALLLPVFVQLGRGLYRSAEPLLDSGGQLLTVPLPLAVAGCVAAVFVLGHFQRAQRGAGFLFLFFVGLLLATIVSTEGHLAAERAKLILLLQVLVPVLGLVLGQMVARPAWPALAQGFLIALWAVAPASLLVGWLQGSWLLQHDLLVFSVYQHRQYVPVVLAAAFLFALAVAPSRSARQTQWLLPIMLLYVIASTSVLAMALLLLGVALLARQRPAMLPSKQAMALVAVIALFYLAFALPSPEFRAKFAFDAGEAESTLLPDAFRARVSVWADYISALLREPRHIAFGFPHPPDRTVLTNANNYYLDFVYNFGLVALLPLLYLAGYTVRRLVGLRDQLRGRPEILMLATIVVFLLVADNGWKVALRQPYSGILSFFLWGLLLSELARLRAPATQAAPLPSGVVSHAH